VTAVTVLRDFYHHESGAPHAPWEDAPQFIRFLADAHQHVIKITAHPRPALLLCF
jgi:hypothetical protein